MSCGTVKRITEPLVGFLFAPATNLRYNLNSYTDKSYVFFLTNPHGGQLDDNSNLPETKRNLMHIWNPTQQDYDVLDLDTGKFTKTAKLTRDSFTFTLQLADDICQYLREGKTLTYICQQPDMPSQAVIYAWMAIYPEFKQRYKEARKQRADYHADKVVDIAEKAYFANKDSIPGFKLAADLHKWAAEKADPESYGPPKDSGKGVGTSISITLNTGVLDSRLPTDILVDVHGNFKGFDDGTQMDLGTGISERMGDEGRGSIELSRDRFSVRDSDSNSEDSEETSGQEDGDKA